MRLIDADKLIMYVADCKLSESITWHEAELITDFILNSPTVESRQKGEWVKESADNDICCSNCRELFPFYYQEYDYCPNCGADMRGE